MSADPGDFSGNLGLEIPRTLPSRRKSKRDVRPGGLRASGWPLAYAGAEEDKAWAVDEDLPPQIVTLVALWEFCRTLLLAPVFAMAVIHPHAQWTSWYFWRVYFVASNGALSVSWIGPATFIYTLVMGTLIWNAVKWSRWVLVGTSLYSALLLGRFLYLFSDYAANLGNSANAGISFLQQSAYVLIVLNVIIAAGMAFAPGVADAFNRNK